MTKRLRIALLIGSSRQFRRDILLGIAAYARLHGPWTFYNQESTPQDDLPDWMNGWSGDGIIGRFESRALLEKVQAMNIPVVDVFGLHKVKEVPSLENNIRIITEMCANHLLERGFENFAFCGLKGLHDSDRFEEDFTQYLQEKGFPVHRFTPPQSPGFKTSFAAESQGVQNEEVLAKWLRPLPKPLGLMACNDLRASQVLNACNQHGIVVPDEVAIIGADNDEIVCELSDPPLTSIDPDARRIGYEAASVLERMILEDKMPSGQTLIPPSKIVVRRSTDVLALGDRNVATAVQFIRDNACLGISVDDVVRQLPLSRSTLERRFTKYLGRTPKAEILRVQLLQVKQFLVSTDYTLAKIANLSGFSHVENMCHFFKAKTGLTPGQFRKQSKSY
jgi:LacI family transcriptional regulator, galactose operon repressor